ncbi:MAG: ABC transporter permease [Phycisphaerae bacterium]|nr:ABC transporter permease [Phycisphaerae bacterium]MDW8262831.1 ABC transporter permease subunit [Phycisphaerales bacterium]
MYRTLVIARHTFRESVVQPIYSLLLGLGAVVIAVFAALPFFTLGEDAVMYKAVALDVILLPVLIATLFATSKSIYEEIEDRTMLTLMSKPIRRWEVLVGKYLGIVSSAALAIAVLGLILVLCLWFRIPGDYQLNPRSVDEADLRLIRDYRTMHIAGILPSLLTLWLQISVLAAIGVALSTRFSLVVNLPVVILVYIAGNLSRFLPDAVADRGALAKAVAWLISTVLPFLQVFDVRDKSVYAKVKWGESFLGISLPRSGFAGDINAVWLGSIWIDAAWSALYAACYATAALAVGLLLFESRELGGAEG